MLRSAPQAGQNSRSSGARSYALVGEGSQILFQAIEFRIAPHHAILKAILRIALTIKERRAGDRLGAICDGPTAKAGARFRVISGPPLERFAATA